METCASCCRLQCISASFETSAISSGHMKILSFPRWSSSIAYATVRRRPFVFPRAVASLTPGPLFIPVESTPQLADILCSISSLRGEAGKERWEVAECLRRMSDEYGCAAEDYERRAMLFQRSGEMAISSKLKGDRVLEELERLQGNVLALDEGRSAADYLLRAEIFSKSAEIFSHSFADEEAPV